MTPSVDFQKMSLGAAAHAEASGLTPLSSPAIQANKVDSFEMEPMSLGRSASGGPSRVGKRGDGSDGLSSPALVAAPYQVPMTGRRRGAKGSSPALGPSPRLNPAGVGRVGSAKLQSPATMPEQMTPELMTMAQQMVPTTLGDAALAAKQMPPGTTFAETQNMPTFAMPNSNNLTGMPMAGMNAPGKNSPLVMPSNGPVPMGMPLPPPAMGPATPASLLNMGRGPGGPPFIPQIPAPFMGVGFHIDPTTGQQFLSPPLGPTEFLLSGGNDPADMRRSSHKVAEQKRRDSLRLCFDELRDLLPPDVIRDEKNPSKVFILKKCG